MPGLRSGTSMGLPLNTAENIEPIAIAPEVAASCAPHNASFEQLSGWIFIAQSCQDAP